MTDTIDHSFPHVDVVIPTYNASALVAECLDALEGELLIARRVVVDDVSDDDTVDMLGERFPAVRVIALDKHQGLAHALNVGAAQCDAPYVLFLNNDVVATPGAVRRLLEALESNPGAVAAGGRLVDPKTGATQDTYRPRDLPGAIGLTVRLLGVERVWPSNPWTGGHLRRKLSDDRVAMVDQQPAGSCMVVRREAFDRVGGWDERYWFWYEDVDLSCRLLDLGPSVFVGTAPFRHVGRHSTRGWRKVDQHRRLYHGTLVYAQTHLPRRSQLLVAAVMTLVCEIRAVALKAMGSRDAEVYAALTRRAIALAIGRPVHEDMRGPSRDRGPGAAPAR